MGIKTVVALFVSRSLLSSEKPPHHMGIKTAKVYGNAVIRGL